MSNELITIEQQKTSFLERVKAFFYRIGNGEKKLEKGTIDRLRDVTEKIMQNDVPALENRSQREGFDFTRKMDEISEKLVVGKTARTNTEIYKAVTASKQAGTRNANLFVIVNLGKNQKKVVLNNAKASLAKDNIVGKQLQTQVEKNVDER